MITRFLRLVAATGLVASLLVAIPASVTAGGGCHGLDGSTHTEGSATVVRMDGCSFSPTVARVPVGTEVRFLNTATIVHAVAGERNEWGSDGNIDLGAEIRHRFDEPGVYPFSCPLHPGMVGAIVVGEPSGAGAATVEPAGGSAGTNPAGAVPIEAVGVVAAGGVVAGLLIAFGWLRTRGRTMAARRTR
jgi:plastocyanin